MPDAVLPDCPPGAGRAACDSERHTPTRARALEILDTVTSFHNGRAVGDTYRARPDGDLRVPSLASRSVESSPRFVGATTLRGTPAVAIDRRVEDVGAERHQTRLAASRGGPGDPGPPLTVPAGGRV